MKIRKLLICSSPRTDIETSLQSMYLKRVKEMFQRATTLESTFNVFDEVFHGITQTSEVGDDLHSFFESFLTITQYYQHSQAGRGSLVAKLLEELGTSEKMEFEFKLNKLPRLFGQNRDLRETEATKQKFDIANKNADNMVLCELKMKTYSGCSAGRIELMGKFNKFTGLVIDNEEFRRVLRDGGIRNVFLIGGVLFDIEGNPATVEKDEEWGICYNGLIRAKNDIINTLRNRNVDFRVDEEKIAERAFIIEFSVQEINVRIIAVYGNEVIRTLFVGNQTHDIGYFKKQLEGISYDDLWLGQIITLSERAVLNQNFKRNGVLTNFIIAIINDNFALSQIRRFASERNLTVLQETTRNIIESIRKSNERLLQSRPIPAEVIMLASGEPYTLESYVADIIQFLSCGDVMTETIGDRGNEELSRITDFM